MSHHSQAELNLPKSPFAFVFRVSKKYKRLAISGVIFAILGLASDNVSPFFVKEIINAATRLMGGTGTLRNIWAVIALYVSFDVFRVVIIWRVAAFTVSPWLQNIQAESSRLLFKHLIYHGEGFFNDRFAGAVAGKISMAAEGLSNLMSKVIWNIGNVILTVVVGLILAYQAKPELALLLFGWTILYVIINYILVGKRKIISKEIAELSTTIQGQMVDVAGNISAVRNYARHFFELRRVSGPIDSRQKLQWRNTVLGEWIDEINTLLSLILTVSTFTLGSYYLSTHTISLGDFVMMLNIVINTLTSIFWVGNLMRDMTENIASAEEGLTDILHSHEIKDCKNARELRVTNGGLDFKDVTFGYTTHPVFENLSLIVPAGQKVGIVGKSGAGKSTLINILLRQYELQSGTISIDGQDITTVTQKSLHENIGIVPQDSVLFHRSVRDNIKYGKLDATDAEVVQAARMAQAIEFIERMPQKFETTVGERGVKLSGGQRQRIVIARAMLKDAPILVLDEATSALDSESEAHIQEALQRLMEHRTVIAVAHRLSTIRAMDRIIVLDEGKIVQDGTHEELLKIPGIYGELWHRQAGGFIGRPSKEVVSIEHPAANTDGRALLELA